jgi:trigger factor
MKVNSVEKNGNKATVIVEIDNELMETGANKAYAKARKSIMIPGFRKGKAPRKMIERMYGAHVFYEDGIEEIFPEIYDFAIAKQEDFKAVGRPSLTDLKINDDNTVTLTLTTEVYPDVTLGQYKGLEVEKAEVSVSDAQVQAELEQMAQNVAATETVDGPAKMGDTANIDFEGFDNGVPFDGGKGENHDLKLGSGSFVPGFEEQIVGMSAGEEKDINITFPEDYHKDLAGKAVVFHVKVNKVTETIVPEMDDEFAKDVSEFDTLEELKADIRSKAMERAEKTAQSNFETACVDKAAESTVVDMPNALVERELDTQMERFAYQLQMSGYSMEQYAKMMGGDVNTMRNAFRPAAEKQAKVSVTLEKIAEVENIAVTDEEIAAEIESLAKQYEMESSKVKEMVPEEELKESIKTRKAVQIIVDSAVAVAPKAEEKSEESAE